MLPGISSGLPLGWRAPSSVRPRFWARFGTRWLRPGPGARTSAWHGSSSARSRPPAEGDGLAGRAVKWLGTRTQLAGRPVLVVGTGAIGVALAAAATAE